MSKRLTRKQIKEDIRHGDLQTAVATTYDKILANQNLIIGVVAGILVLLIAFVIVRVVLANRAEAATEELAEAVRIFEAPVGDEAVADGAPAPALRFATDDERRARAREAFEAVEGGKAETVAGLYLADLALREGDKETARRHWEEYLDEQDDDDMLAISVRLNLLRLDREEGRGEEAVGYLEDELVSGDPDLPEDVILLELAKTLETLGRDDEAGDYYQRILDDHPRSPYAAAAREKTAG